MTLRIEALATASPVVLAAALAGALGPAPVPARAGPPRCAPTANGQTGSASRTDAPGTQVCSGGDTAVAGDSLTNATGAGLSATSVDGAVSITADGHVTAAARGAGAPVSDRFDGAIGDGCTSEDLTAALRYRWRRPPGAVGG